MADYVGVEYQDVLDIIKSVQTDLTSLKFKLKDYKTFDASISSMVDDIIAKVADLNKQA